MKKKRTSPMKGRKISKEDRGPDAPKLGRPFIHENAERFVMSASVPPEMIDDLLEYYQTDKKGTMLRLLIEEKHAEIK